MPFDLDLSQARPVLNRLGAIFTPSVADDILLAAGRTVGMKAESFVANPYPQASGKALPVWYDRTSKDGKPFKSKFKSLAQQRKVMSLVKAGKVPYRRTGTLGKSITSKADPGGAGLVIVRVGSNLTYAPYVISRLMQSHYHMGTWSTLDDDIQRGLPQLAQTAMNAVTKEVNRRLSSG